MSFQTPITIAAAIQRIDTNRFLLPAIQREFVWGCDRIEWLFDSLMKDYPISSFLLWRVEGESKTAFRYYSILKEYRQFFKTHNQEINTHGLPDFEAVLDGQQRLTSLYIGLKGSYAYKTRNFAKRNTEHCIPTRYLYLDITAPLEEEEEEDSRTYNFLFRTPREVEADGGREKWFRVGEILELGDNFEFNRYMDEHNYKTNPFTYRTLSKLQNLIHTKPVINYFLETEQNYDKALNIFIRINKGGEPLNYSDLLMSITVASWDKTDARQEFHRLVDYVRDLDFSISTDFILKTYLVLHSKDIKSRVQNFDDRTAKDFQSKWDDIKSAIYSAFELVRTFGYTDFTLTSKNAVIPIVYWIYHLKRAKDYHKVVGHKREREIIKRWLHSVLLHQIFGGQAESVLKIIRDVLKSAINDGVTVFPAKLIAERLSGTNKSITVNDEFLSGLLYNEYEDRYTFPILALLYPHLDYRNGDFHKDHIHPVSRFSKKAIENSSVDTTDTRFEYFSDSSCYNGIINLQLLDGNENKAKQDKTLEEWVACNAVDLNKHLIPNIIPFTRFPDFVDARRELLKNRLKEVLTFTEEQELITDEVKVDQSAMVPLN